MKNRQDIAVDKVSSLRDLVRGDNSLYRRLRCASPTVNRVLSLRDLRTKPCKGDTLLTVGVAEGATYGAEAASPRKSRRDDTLLTVCFSLRTGKRRSSAKSRRDDTLLTVISYIFSIIK
jgi:hypothetical protein